MLPRQCIVVGTLELGLVYRVERLPKDPSLVPRDIGEPELIFSGAGFFQAVAIARSGINVRFVACVGIDNFGRFLIDGLHEQGIKVEHIQCLAANHTDTRLIWIDADNQQLTVARTGASLELSSNWIVQLRDQIVTAGVVVMYGDVSTEVSTAVYQLTGQADVLVLVNPSPEEVVSRFS